MFDLSVNNNSVDEHYYYNILIQLNNEYNDTQEYDHKAEIFPTSFRVNNVFCLFFAGPSLGLNEMNFVYSQ